MFERFSLSLSRIFRLRSRRGTKPNVGSARVAPRSTSEPPPSKSCPPVVSQLEPINTTLTPSTTRPHTLFIPSILSPIAQSPIATSPGVTPIPDTLAPILIIGPDPVQSTLPPPTGPALPGDVGSQTHVPAHPNTRRVSFQLPTTTCSEELPESPLSMCSTLVPEVESEAETSPAFPPEQYSLASGTPDSGSGPVRARPVSLLGPLPVRVNPSRLSLPVTPTTPTMTTSTNARDSRRESKRTSLMPPIAGSGSVKKEKRTSIWNEELSKPETQAVLRALRGF